MNNKKQGTGTVIQGTNGSGSAIAAGMPIDLGDQGLHGICIEDIANGATGSVLIPDGVIISFPVKGHDGSSNAAIAAYDKVYHTPGDAFYDVTAAATLAGYVLSAVTSGETTTSEVLLARA